MIYIIITFPLIIFCVTLKGHSVMENPQNMCSGISTANTAGIILTMCYVGLYLIFRSGNLVLIPIINLFKNVYILNIVINPILKGLLGVFDSIKYVGLAVIPGIGSMMLSLFVMLTPMMSVLNIILLTISDIGCKSTFSAESFKKKLMSNINKETNKSEPNIANSFINSNKEPICIEKDNVKCCAPSNYISIGDILLNILDTPLTSFVIKKANMFPHFVLFTEALYESAMARLSDNDSSNTYLSQGVNVQRAYLRKMLEEKHNDISSATRTLISTFLNTDSKDDNVLINQIKEKLGTDVNKNNNNIIDIKSKLQQLNVMMIDFSVKDGSRYIKGPSLTKTVFKIIFVDIFCNIFQTSHSSVNVIQEMGEMAEVTDMIKAGITAGVFTSIFYILTIIILIICIIFNIF